MYLHKENNATNYNEFCNHCGRSVKFGSGFFINRIPDFNDLITRVENGRKYPSGDYVCIECDSKENEE